MSNLAENIRRLRMAKGWTTDNLAIRAGVSSVRMIESGRRPNARYVTILAIANALGVGVGELYGNGKK